MMLPWPAMSRGTDIEVPSPPGLVSVIEPPAKSSGMSLLPRAFATSAFVGGEEGREIEGVGALDDGHDQSARAVLALDVDGEAESEV